MGSIGSRIRTIREGRNIKAQVLADELGVSPSAVSLIEADKRAVKSREVSLIAAALGVSPLAILEDDTLLSRLPMAARSATIDAPVDEAYQRITALAELSEVLAAAGIPAQPKLDDKPDVSDASWLEGARTLAMWAHQAIALDEDEEGRLGALADGIEAHLGVDVLIEDFPADALLGAAITDPGTPLIFVNANSPAPRALFTMAHELGHVLATHAGGLALDQRGGDNTALEERFTNAFAAEFLMPKDAVIAAIAEHGRTAAALGKMLGKFEVSYEALVYRLHNLRIINAEGRDDLLAVGWTGLRQQLQGNDWLPVVQMRTSSPPDRSPALLTERALRGYYDGVISIRPLTSLLNRSEEELLSELGSTEVDSFEVFEASTYDEFDSSEPDEEAFGYVL